MWYGKLSVIMMLFSISLSWGMYEICTLYPISNPNVAWTQSHISEMATSYAAISNLNGGNNPNPALIFGDFISGLTVFLNALLVAGNSAFGGGLSSVLQGIPGIDYNISLLVQIIYGSATVAIWIYIVAFRSI